MLKPERCGNVLHVWFQFYTALCARNAHITLYDVTTWSWVPGELSEPHAQLERERCDLWEDPIQLSRTNQR